jgi:hypothetical protein
MDTTDKRCTLCGARPVGRVDVSLHGELTCAGHTIAGRCVFCTRPHARPDQPGWRRFTGQLLRCPTCQVGAVETQMHARRWLPVVRSEMARIGVSLPVRVLVRLVGPDKLDPFRVPSAQGVLLGVTEQVVIGEGATEVVEIRVAAGQPPLQFGRCVVHEIGHAWITQQGGPRPDPGVEEGLCELFAHGWLKQQPGAAAEELRRGLHENPDPVYGGGFRTVHAAARAHGVGPVMLALSRTGELPRPPGWPAPT